MNLKSDDFVRVLWIDSAGGSGNWYSTEEMEEYIAHHRNPPLVESVGYLQHRDGAILILAQSRHAGAKHGVICIPSGSVRDIALLRIVEEDEA